MLISTFRRLCHLLWNGVHMYSDHRNLASILNPKACVPSVSKTFVQGLENWKASIG